MIKIEIVVDEHGAVGWRANIADLSTVHWYLSIASKTVLEQATTPQSQIIKPASPLARVS